MQLGRPKNKATIQEVPYPIYPPVVAGREIPELNEHSNDSAASNSMEDFPARHVWSWCDPGSPWIPVLCVRPLKGNLQSHPGQQGLGVLTPNMACHLHLLIGKGMKLERTNMKLTWFFWKLFLGYMIYHIICCFDVSIWIIVNVNICSSCSLCALSFKLCQLMLLLCYSKFFVTYILNCLLTAFDSYSLD